MLVRETASLNRSRESFFRSARSPVVSQHARPSKQRHEEFPSRCTVRRDSLVQLRNAILGMAPARQSPAVKAMGRTKPEKKPLLGTERNQSLRSLLGRLSFAALVMHS